eukprot:6180659-Pleurochrysis_carterae.AAC.1
MHMRVDARRCMFVSWVGPNVMGMARARVSMHRNDVSAFVRPVVSVDLQARRGVCAHAFVCRGLGGGSFGR